MTQTLERAFPIVAAALGNHFGISIKIGGTDAYTNGRSIQLPAYDGSNPDYQSAAWGYLAHEAAHIRFSDFEIDFGDSVLRLRICQAIEDVRIEHELAKVYPGTRLTLAKVVEKMIGEGRFVAQKADEHPGNILYGYILKRLRATVLGQTVLMPLVDQTRDALRANFPRGALIRLEGLLSEVPDGLSCERDCLDLTDRILTMIEEEVEKARDSAADSSDSDAANDADAADETDQDNPPASGDDGDSGQDDSDGDPQNGSPEPASVPSQPDVPTSPSGDEVVTLMDQLNATAEHDLEPDWFETVKAQLRLAPGTCENCVLPIGMIPTGSHLVGQTLANKVAQDSKALRVALQSAVQAHRHNRPQAVRQGRRIAGSRLSRVAQGDTRLFIRPHQRISPNTALHILLDKSESMDDKIAVNGETVTLLSLALDAAMALALALEGIQGVNPAITAFPGADDDSVHQVLRHGEKVVNGLERFSLRAAHTTPMTQAVWYAAAQLLQCREPRKVLLVITDGVPNDKTSTLSILKRCRDCGIETIGIGLGVMVDHLFPVALSIQDIAELRHQLFNLSKAMLLAA
ncbi:MULTISPECIES: VWA domain-containing protein [Methylomonas]|uniref:VWFA domain-containing protein n=1 Tax=Methylomonas koyamae TaxID=702114 RepID=A0A177N6K3_9GAMM|nr:VWA domain-containing protein [Methylomonas koyamae]OAI12760.1 hypothetical protein A1355_14055 [Methylomonas koyamae]